MPIVITIIEAISLFLHGLGLSAEAFSIIHHMLGMTTMKIKMHNNKWLLEKLLFNSLPEEQKQKILKMWNELYPEHNLYEGNFKNGKFRGRGKLTDELKSYEGNFKNGKKHGQGKETWVTGDVYEGKWKNGFEHGQGKATYTSGQVYDGEWKDGKYHGNGTKTYANGDIYVGEWKNGSKHGQGKYTWPDGSVYEGEWRNDNHLGLEKAIKKGITHWYRLLYPFKAVEEGELSCLKGEAVKATKPREDSTDGWLCVSRVWSPKYENGYVPVEYLEHCSLPHLYEWSLQCESNSWWPKQGKNMIHLEIEEIN